MNSKKYDVMISYSRGATGFIGDLVQRLENANISYWYDKDIEPTSFDWRVSILESIQEAFVVVVVMDQDAAKSVYVNFEVAYAMGVGLPIFMLFREKFDEKEFNGMFRTQQRYNFDERVPRPWEQLCQDIQRKVEEIRSQPQPLEQRIQQEKQRFEQQLAETETRFSDYKVELINTLQDLRELDRIKDDDLSTFMLNNLITSDERDEILKEVRDLIQQFSGVNAPNSLTAKPLFSHKPEPPPAEKPTEPPLPAKPGVTTDKPDDNSQQDTEPTDNAGD